MASSSSIDYSSFEGLSNGKSATQPSQNSDDIVQDVKYLQIDFWYGQIYFNCLLAQGVFSKATSGCSSMNLDSMLQTRKARYDYRAALDLCRTRGVGNLAEGLPGADEDAFTSLMMFIGKTFRNSGMNNVEMVRILRETGSGNESPKQNGVRMNSALEMRYPWEEEGPTELHRYTSALKERGDQLGFIPDYTCQTLSLNPPLFQAEVSVSGRSCIGRGRTKQIAKHEASKEACDLWDIRIS